MMKAIPGAALVLFSALAVGCASTDQGGPETDETNLTQAGQEEETLTLENVFLGHANLAAWEPGDQRYYFPVAAHIFYGYRTYDGYEIEVSSNCKDSIRVKRANEAGAMRDAKYTLSCAPDGDESKAFAFTTDSQTFGQEEDMGTYGTSFTFAPTVTLKKTGPKKYLLDIGEP